MADDTRWFRCSECNYEEQEQTAMEGYDCPECGESMERIYV